MRGSILTMLLVLLAAGALTERARAVDVVLRLVDQHGAEIAGSFLDPAPEGGAVPTGSTVSLAEGVHTVRLFPGVFGTTAGGLVRRDDTVTVTASTTELAFEWITADVVLHLHDQHDVDIAGSILFFHPPDAARITGDVASLPITDESVYPTMFGAALDGYPIMIAPSILGSTTAQPLRREETAEVLAGDTELAFEWITADVVLRLHDQHDVDIAGSILHFTPPYVVRDTGDVASLPITDESVYPTMFGTALDGYPIDVFPLPSSSHLRRRIAAEVGAGSTQLAAEWIVIDCATQVVDAAGAPVAGSSLALPSPFPAFVPGDVVRFPVTDDAVYPTIASTYATGYPIAVMPGDVAPASATVAFEVLASGELTPSTFLVAGNAYSLACETNEPPLCLTAGDLTVECESAAGALVTLSVSASDPDDDDLMYHWDVSDLDVVLDDAESESPSGVFPIGITMATVTVTDGRGGVATCDLLVTVEDTTPPEVLCTTDLASLWPPNHTMRTVTVIVTGTDLCSAPEAILPISVLVRSDEPDDAPGGGDGGTTGDVAGQDGFSAPVDITDQLTFDETLGDEGAWIAQINLRAERAGSGDGRSYMIDVLAMDSHSNPATASCVVVVPHDRRGGGGG